MFRVLLVAYYGETEYFQGLASALRAQGLHVDTFGLHRLVHDAHERVDNYLQVFDDHIRRTKPDVLLWQCLALRPKEMAQIRARHPEALHVHYNQMEPVVWDELDAEFARKQQSLDVVFVSTLVRAADYRGEAILAPQCVDTHHFAPTHDTNFAADVVVMLNNLREGSPDLNFRRRDLLAALERAHARKDFGVKLYAPAWAREMCPGIYAGEAPYALRPRLFSNAKLCLCLNPAGAVESSISVRAVSAMACGALVVMDEVPGMARWVVPGEDCLVLRRQIFGAPNTMIHHQLREILADVEKHAQIRTRARAKAVAEWSFDAFARLFVDTLAERLVDVAYYAERHGLPADKAAVMAHWRDVGRARGLLLRPVAPPRNFDAATYVATHCLDAAALDTPLKVYTYFLETGSALGHYICLKPTDVHGRSGDRPGAITPPPVGARINTDADGREALSGPDAIALYANIVAGLSRKETLASLRRAAKIAERNPRLDLNAALVECLNAVL